MTACTDPAAPRGSRRHEDTKDTKTTSFVSWSSCLRTFVSDLDRQCVSEERSRRERRKMAPWRQQAARERRKMAPWRQQAARERRKMAPWREQAAREDQK